MVLSHFDHDHIDGLYRYVDSRISDRPFPVDEIWCNCGHSIVAPSTNTRVSYSEANNFASVLKRIEGLKWTENIHEGKERNLNFCSIHVVSPTKDDLKRNKDEYENVVNKRIESQTVKVSQNRIVANQQIPFEELALRETPKVATNKDLINKSSIAFILECDGKRY